VLFTRKRTVQLAQLYSLPFWFPNQPGNVRKSEFKMEQANKLAENNKMPDSHKVSAVIMQVVGFFKEHM